MKNLETVKKLEAFILYVLMHKEKYSIPEDVEISRLLKYFKTIPEKGGEIFKRPDMVYKMLMGDCDDWTTLISFVAHKKKIPFKHVYVLKNDYPVHIFPILKIQNNWVVVDPWQLRKPFVYREKKNQIEVETCLKMTGICQRF